MRRWIALSAVCALREPAHACTAAAITININVDMLSSSNGVYFVQDGDGAHTVPPGPVRPGRSAELEHVLTSYLESQGLPWVARPYDGRSDYMSSSTPGSVRAA
jgi:hypothetical protein